MQDREIELKFELGPTGAAHLARSLARLGAERIGSNRLISTYFDTEARALRRHGVALRLRSVGDRRVQTIKEASTKTAGLFNRSEWESEISGEAPDLSVSGGACVASLIGSAPLRPVFTTDIERTTWRLATPPTEIEIALDTGDIVAGQSVDKVVEAELELKRGVSRDLFQLAKTLFADETVRLSASSKSDRGYLVMKGEAPVSFKAGRIGLRPELTTAEALAVILQACLRHFRLNEPGIMQVRNAEAVHQARVALRRLRSAFSLFKSVLSGQDTVAHRAFARELAQSLGEARNIDVFLLRHQAMEAAAHSAHIRRVEAVREEAYNEVIRALGAPRSGMQLLDLAAWIECGSWRSGATRGQRKRLDRPIAHTAPRILHRQWEKLREAPRLEKMSAAAQHKIRIKGKRLRYASEFFGDLYLGAPSRKAYKLFVQRLTRLQDDLGELNDIETGKRLIARLDKDAPQPDPSDIAPSMAPDAPVRHRTEAEILEDAVVSFERLKETPAFWEPHATNESGGH